MENRAGVGSRDGDGGGRVGGRERQMTGGWLAVMVQAPVDGDGMTDDEEEEEEEGGGGKKEKSGENKRQGQEEDGFDKMISVPTYISRK